MNKIVEYIIRAKDATASGIKSAMGRIKGFAAGLGRNLANVQAGLQMVMGAVRTFAAVFAKSIGEAFKFEKAVTDFKVLLGSVKSARNHIADLKKFAASTPLTFGDLSQASKLLLSFGSSVDEIMPSLRTLGDIAMGDAQKFQGLALVFAQVKSQGKLMGQDLLQMINQGFNPLTVISKETGKSMSELKDIMAEGKISFEMVAEAMRLATSEGGLFNNAMKEASTTGEGLLSTLEDNWIDTLRAFGEELMVVAKGGIQWCINKLQELKESGKIQEWAEKAKKAIYTVIGAFNGLSDASTRAETWTAMKDMVVGGFEEGARLAVTILHKGFQALLNMIGSSSLNPFNKESQWNKEVRVAKEMGIKGVGMWSWDHEVEGIEKVRAEIRRRELEEAKKIYGDDEVSGSRFTRGLNALKKLGMQAIANGAIIDEETSGTTESAPKSPDTGIRSLREQMDEVRSGIREAVSNTGQKEAEQAAKAAAKAAAEAEKKERLRVEREIAAERKRLREAEFRETAAQTRLDAARSASQQAWGWYRDKDSLKAQLEEERADAAAQAQFEKDFEKLRQRSDWRTAAAYGSGKMRSLSLDEEATRRVALAREEEKAAEEYAKQTAEECKRSADALAELQKTICGEG